MTPAQGTSLASTSSSCRYERQARARHVWVGTDSLTAQVQELLGALSRVAQERDAALSNASTVSYAGRTHSTVTGGRRGSVTSSGSAPDQVGADRDKDLHGGHSPAVHDAVLSRVHFSRTEAGPASAEVEQLLAELAKERAAVAASAADVEDLEAALGHATVSSVPCTSRCLACGVSHEAVCC